MSNQRKIFNEIYDKYIAKIYRFVFIKVSSKEIAEDLTSEVFVRIWKSIERGVLIENPNAFLYRIARNLVTDYYRQKPQHQVVLAENEELADTDTNVHEQATDQSDFEIIKANMNSLGSDYQEVITLYYMEDYSIAEIAKILERPEGTVRVMLHRGLEELKEKMNIKSV